MESVWTKTCELEKHESLSGKIETEVAVIGGGMAGILIAYKLWKAGKQVVVLEGNRVGSGQTKNTTAKITSQHGMIYRGLIEKFGKEKAAQYARANEAAIREYKRMIQEEAIACDFEETSSYLYCQNLGQLEEEAKAAVSLGLPAAFVGKIQIPVSCAGAVKFENQGQFHPLKFLKALAQKLTIYENTPVKTVEAKEIRTEFGLVKAEHIVFACHYPFVNFPGLYFARMHQERSYVLALEHAANVDGMYLGVGENAYSFRNYGDLLLFGGENHRTGEVFAGSHYDALRKKAKEFYPESREVACWSAQDCMTGDDVPYIGVYADGKPGWYVATGFRKWGMTTSMVAAMLLCDRICGIENPYAEIFEPKRFGVGEIPWIAMESGNAVKGLARRMFQIPEETVKSLAPGKGGVLSLDGEKTGVYKDEKGELFAVDIRCPHLGCQLEWNPDEKTWDCPCHGSRFDYHGKLISNPAQEDIAHN